MKIPGIGFVAKKAAEGFRRYYGAQLIKPSTRKVYREAINAASEGNIAAYRNATDVLKKEQGMIGYQEPKRLEYRPKK